MIPFLQPTINSIRKSIRDIDDSYNNFWDILAELIQNSVDAIKATEKEGSLLIDIDAIEKTIRVKDNGIGIKNCEIADLLRPFSTNKDNDSNSIGEKGVGLKFVIFQSDNFFLKTKYKDEKIISNAIINGAKAWKNGDSSEDLLLDLQSQESDDNFQGTEILVKGIENEKLFNMNFDTLKFILRTKTAVGNVLNIFEDQNNIKVTFNYRDLNGVNNSEEIPYKYWLPIENVKTTDKLNLEDYNNWLSERDRSDSEKRNKLKNKIIYCHGEILHNDVRSIKYWLCFVPKRRIWNDLSVKDHLLNEQAVDDEEILRDKNLCIHQAGIYTSVKGMPTGITITPPSTGNAGYWANLFIILEDKQLRFDIGRKSFHSSVQTMYQKHLKDLFNNVTSKITKYISGDPEVNTRSIWNRDNIRDEINSLPDLNNLEVRFLKLPNEQEASVSAIFFELIGSGAFNGLQPIISGYRNKYDLYANYKNHFIVMEFKSHLRNIIRDFDDLSKLSNEIDYIVCWDVNDDDTTELHNAGLFLEKISSSDLFDSDAECMEECTHKLIVSSSAQPIYVIDLKIVIERLEE